MPVAKRQRTCARCNRCGHCSSNYLPTSAYKDWVSSVADGIEKSCERVPQCYQHQLAARVGGLQISAWLSVVRKSVLQMRAASQVKLPTEAHHLIMNFLGDPLPNAGIGALLRARTCAGIARGVDEVKQRVREMVRGFVEKHALPRADLGHTSMEEVGWLDWNDFDFSYEFSNEILNAADHTFDLFKTVLEEEGMTIEEEAEQDYGYTVGFRLSWA